MFGYLRYDLPNLYHKDHVLYRALYCGLCVGIGKTTGMIPRLALSYDLTTFSAILHNIAGQDVKIEKKNCFESIRPHPIAALDDMTRALGALNTVLTYYKFEDDVLDKEGGKVERLFFTSGFKRAKAAYPEMVEIVDRNMKMQRVAEEQGVSSPDMAADATANMIKELSAYLLKDKATEYTNGLFYAVGKWVYLIDALDDFEKDKKKKSYNPFLLSYEGETRADLLQKNAKEISFLFDSIFYDIRENFRKIKFFFNHDLVDNLLFKGIPSETQRVMRGEKRKSSKDVY